MNNPDYKIFLDALTSLIGEAEGYCIEASAERQPQECRDMMWKICGASELVSKLLSRDSEGGD